MNRDGPPRDKRPPLPNGPGHGKPKGAKNKLTRARVEEELRYLALSDPIALFDRGAKGRRTFTLRAIHAMAPEMRRCIASVKVRTENLASGDGTQDTTVEVRLWDKVRALELCARSLGMLTDRVEVVDPQARVTRLQAARARLATDDPS